MNAPTSHTPTLAPARRMRAVRLALVLAGAAMGVALCWFVANMVAGAMAAHDVRQMVDTRRQLAAQVAEGMSNQVTADVALLRAIPQTLAQIDAVPQAVALVEKRRWSLIGQG